MASGMGMPSMAIYSYELYNVFRVENIIRVGSAGAMHKDVKVRDIVLGMGACTNSAYAKQYKLDGSFAPICDFELLKRTVRIGEEKKLPLHVGNILSSDTFYDDDAESNARWRKMGVLAVEMEAAALYMNAARANKKALAICTISDSLITGESLSSDERQNSFVDMMELALDVAAECGEKRE
jgi:purine-nucleoside phosphorylase